METKSIGIKKGASIRDIMLVIVIGIFAFGAIVAFVTDNAQEKEITVDPQYNETYNSLLALQNRIDGLTTDIRNATSSLKEANIGDFAFFGLRGVLKVMLLPLNILDIAQESFATTFKVTGLPDSLKAVIALCILIVIIFAVIKFVTSRATEA
jgi:hypothetical protein